MCLTGALSLATGTPDAEGVRGTLALFLVLAGLLAVFLLAVVLLTVLRHRRDRQRKPKPKDQPMADPWEEAGRRARPYRNR